MASHGHKRIGVNGPGGLSSVGGGTRVVDTRDGSVHPLTSPLVLAVLPSSPFLRLCPRAIEYAILDHLYMEEILFTLVQVHRHGRRRIIEYLSQLRSLTLVTVDCHVLRLVERHVRHMQTIDMYTSDSKWMSKMIGECTATFQGIKSDHLRHTLSETVYVTCPRTQTLVFNSYMDSKTDEPLRYHVFVIPICFSSLVFCM